MKKLTPKDKYYIGAALFISCIFFLLIFLFLYMPHQKEMSTARAKIEENKKHLQILKSFSEKIDNDKDFLQKSVTENIFWKNKMPDTQNQTSFISALHQLAVKNKVQITAISPVPLLKQNKDYMETVLRIKTQSDYFSLLDFLAQLEEADRYNIVNKINIMNKNNLLETELEIKIFSLPEK